MSETNSGPALPAMSLRDYFAGQAIAGLCADSSWTEEFSHETTAVWAYNLADAMLEARAARTGEAA